MSHNFDYITATMTATSIPPTDTATAVTSPSLLTSPPSLPQITHTSTIPSPSSTTSHSSSSSPPPSSPSTSSSSLSTPATESIRVGTSVEAIKQAFLDNLAYVQGKFAPIASKNDYYMALAYTIRDRLMASWIKTSKMYLEQIARTICYFSAEFLLGPQLGSNINNLGIYANVSQAMQELGLNLDELIEAELEPSLGNGGLGRLAACYMDSLATLNIPAIGYGIHYEFGTFTQDIRDGWQVECTDKWLRHGNPWEIARPEIIFDVKFGGHTEHYIDANGRYQVKWMASGTIKGIAHDIPIIAYKADAANFLRLWQAEAGESFNFQAFNIGDYYGAVQTKIASENITKVLYPNDEQTGGKKLRLQQQYFLVSSSLQDMIRIYLQRQSDLSGFHKKYAAQLNDTHPAIAIVELMRLLVDEHQMKWEDAWHVTQQTFAYTNHTILPEAMERWSVPLFASILPRHLELIFEINRRFLDEVRHKFPHDEERVKRVSLIDEENERHVRMTNLACVGCHAINGVSHLHTDLLKHQVLRDFYALWPEKFSNKTNGITPRRFLLLDNAPLANFITNTIGDTWIKDLENLRKLEDYAADKEFQKIWRNIKQQNKQALAKVIQRRTAIVVDPNSLFDIQAKRIHEYKRQHLNILHVITLYNRIRNNINMDFLPRTVIFAGKAAPGYLIAKLMIKLIHAVAAVINNDPVTEGKLRVAFIPNFNVKEAHHIYPAANLSEQISTAGKEASGTGNMKFALNGALTIGTLDGANVEMREEFGEENFFIFGLKADEIVQMKNNGYDPKKFIMANEELRAAIELISNGYFSRNNATDLFMPLIDTLLHRDTYMLCADYRSYIECQSTIEQLYLDAAQWEERSILSVARMGKFSSDRAIREYARDIWQVEPIAATN